MSWFFSRKGYEEHIKILERQLEARVKLSETQREYSQIIRENLDTYRAAFEGLKAQILRVSNNPSRENINRLKEIADFYSNQ